MTEATTVTVNELTLNDGTGKASNYSLANGQSAAAKINKKALTATATASDKTYDGNTTATGTTLALSGLITGEKITATVNKSTFNSKDVTEATTVTVNELTLNDGTNGEKASNYRLATGQSAAAKITAKALTITANDASKIYGETLTFDGTEFEVEEGALQNGETISKVTLTSPGAAETANVDDYTITAAAATAAEDSGFNAGNYTITYKAGTLDVVAPLNVSGAVEPGSSSTVSKAPSAANPTRPETCVETNGMAPLVLDLPELTEYCADTSGSNPAQRTLVEKSGIALPTASNLLSPAALRQ